MRRKALDIFATLIRKSLMLLGSDMQVRAQASLVESLTPTCSILIEKGENLFFHCPGDLLVLRARWLLTKEPDTIAWINNFEREAVLWDIGANVGSFSLYAAVRKGSRVLAFEPAAFNFHILTKNVELNKLSDSIDAYCIAFAEVCKVGHLFMSSTVTGSALHNFDEEVDQYGRPFLPVFKQAALSYTIDEFIDRFDVPFPAYIKIDVDGIEGKILYGARRTLADPRLRSIYVELDTSQDSYSDLIIFLEQLGFALKATYRSPMDQEGEVVQNHEFWRS